MFVTQRAANARHRLIAAASELFAERGFHATTARDIARRAGVNLAAANYYFGSKKELYLEVLRAQFAEIWRTLRQRGGTKSPAELARLSRGALFDLLHTRIRLMLDKLIGPPPGLHGALLQRELADPSQALPVIAEEFVGPMTRETEQIVARIAPRLDAEAVERCALSIVGQAVFYRIAMPLILHGKRWKSYPPSFGARLAGHIATFSLGGMEGLSKRKRRKPRAR